MARVWSAARLARAAEAKNTWESTEYEAGLSLAYDLNPWIGTTTGIVRTCVELVELAREHADLAVIMCNRNLRPSEVDRLNDLHELLAEQVQALPEPETEEHGRGQWRLQTGGDPRGRTVELLAPEHRAGQLEGIVVDR